MLCVGSCTTSCAPSWPEEGPWCPLTGDWPYNSFLNTTPACWPCPSWPWRPGPWSRPPRCWWMSCAGWLPLSAPSSRSGARWWWLIQPPSSSTSKTTIPHVSQFCLFVCVCPDTSQKTLPFLASLVCWFYCNVEPEREWTSLQAWHKSVFWDARRVLSVFCFVDRIFDIYCVMTKCVLPWYNRTG